MMIQIRSLAAALLSAGTCAFAVNAAAAVETIALYNFNDSSEGTVTDHDGNAAPPDSDDVIDVISDDISTSSVAGNLVIGSGLGPSSNPVRNGGSGNNGADGAYAEGSGSSYDFRMQGGTAGASSFANAVSGNEFVGFSLTPGVAIDLAALTVDYTRTSGSGENHSFDTLALTINGVQFGGNKSVASTTGGTVAWDLSSLADINSATVFNIYIWGGSQNQARGGDIDDITLTGNPIPEPGSLALLTLAAALIIRRR